MQMVDSGLRWNHRFATLGAPFYTRLAPQPLPAPYWVGRSRQMAEVLGLSDAWLASDEALHALTGNLPLSGSSPLASVYSGHQFGYWAGQLGDGRAILLGEAVAQDGTGLELQLKGSGLTPYSRMGDGRAVLRSSIREFLCSEAMHGLGIATTRALCVTGSSAQVRRETVETAAVVARVAPSFIRFGHFEHFCHTRQHAHLRTLADFVIEHHYPDCALTTRFGGNRYAALLEAVTLRTAELMAQWQAVGFCHGVMNTDNMSILGLTLDYGPFQFLDAFDPSHICNHSDNEGRYAYQNQPNIAYWNLFCLGQALLPLLDDQDQALAALEPYRSRFPAELQQRMWAKLGLTPPAVADKLTTSAFASEEAEPYNAPPGLVNRILQLLEANQVDYTIFWRRLSQHVAGSPVDVVRDLFLDRPAVDAWLADYQTARTGHDPIAQSQRMLRVNPKFVLRNHLGELVIRAAQAGDMAPLARLQNVLEAPFDEHPGHDDLADFPPDWATTIHISCSS
jgi:uncharacterized protein YdiU (UPF0061 family)